jgi:hypothetical protein
MNDKAGLAASQDYGKDDAATEKLLTKHAALETDVESFSSQILGLAKDATRLVHSGHFDSVKIKSMQVGWSKISCDFFYEVCYEGALFVKIAFMMLICQPNCRIDVF